MTNSARPVSANDEPRSRAISPQEALDTLTVVPLVSGEPSAASILGVSTKTARRLYWSGALPALSFGRKLMVPTAALRAILDGGGPGTAA